jgi:hypothetical protein
MAEEDITNAIDFLTKIRNEEEVTVKFTKADGTNRIMRCTLDFDKIPRDQKPKKVDLPKILKLLNTNKILHVFDLDKQGWRSLPFSRSEWLETPSKKVYKIKPKK